MKGFFGLLMVVLLVFPIVMVWTVSESENATNRALEKKLIFLERKKAVEKDVRFIFSEAVKRSKNKEELVANLMYAIKTLENDHGLKFYAGWCGGENLLFLVDEKVNEKKILEVILEYGEKAAISHGPPEFSDFSLGKKACVVADGSVGDINFTISWGEGEI